MKIYVDTDVCQEHGQCVLIAPEVFDLGIEGLVYDANPSDDLADSVEDAAAACPVQAILTGTAG